MIEKSDELPFTAVVTETGGSIRLTIPVGIKQALQLEPGDIVEGRIKKVMQKPIVIDDRVTG